MSIAEAYQKVTGTRTSETLKKQPSSASSPLNANYKPTDGSKILMYPSDVGINVHQASFILFARHSVSGAKVKQQKKAPKVAPIMKNVTYDSPDEGTLVTYQVIDAKATKAAQDKSDINHEAKEGNIAGRGGANKGGASTSLLLQKQNITRTGAFIGLYMPPSVNVSYSMDYSEAEIGVMGEALYGMFKDYQNNTSSEDSMNKAGATLAPALVNMGVGMIDKVLPGVKDIASIERGTIITPRTEMMFKGIGRREFSFTFTFIPKDATESETVHSIVQEFKEGMSPSFKIAGSTREMTIPDVFSIQYMHMSGQNSYINKIGKCYLKTMDVTYGGDKFVTYNANERGAPPQKTNITLAFQELEVMDRSNIKDGF
mgnify:CR=1 FL=1